MDTLFQSAFGDSAELTAAIQRTPYNPGQIAKLKLFDEAGIASTSIAIDLRDNALTMLPTSPRGGVGEPLRMGSRSMVTIEACHIATIGAAYADECQGVRDFGTASALESPTDLLNRKLQTMKNNLEVTIEQHRAGAIRGLVQDTDGSTVLDVYAAFGLSQTAYSMGLAGSGNLVNKTIGAERECQASLGGEDPTGFLALCSPSFMDALRSNGYYDSALRFAAPSTMLAGYTSGIKVGDTTFIEVRSTPGLPVKIPAGEGYLIPLGINGLFITRFAPGDYLSTVNQPGLPAYVQSQMMDMGKGYRLEAQTNHVSLCTRPAAVIKLTVA